MKVYAVFKTGVYRHECGGVFSTIEAAEQAAERLISGERDDYHQYEMVAFDLDAVTRQTPIAINAEGADATCGELEEAPALCTWRRIYGVIEKDKARGKV